MRRVLLITTALAVGLTSTAWAGAKDKSQNTLVDIGAAGIINNTTVKTKVKSKGCTLQLQAKPVTGLAASELVICLAEADVNGFGGSLIIFTAEEKKAQLKVKVDLGEAVLLSNSCGSLESISYNGNLKCYRDDATFRSNATGAGTWRDACAAAGMVAGDGPGATLHKVNDTVPVVVGICQDLSPSPGARIDAGALGLVEWARQGQRTAVD